jgi:DNA repair exonuclease SbcCD ATPase subunit
MQFRKLTIENFMAIGIASMNLSNRGLLLVQGENEDDTSQDSNGAGKSSIVDALCWALYGKTARGVSGDSIVNRAAKKNTLVSVEIAITDEEVYTVSRHRKHKDHKNAVRVVHQVKGAMPTDLTKGTDKLTQELVNKIIGASADVFKAAIYSGQEDQVDLPNLTDKHLKAIVEEAAGVDKLQEAHDIAKKAANEIDKEVSAFSSKLETLRLALEADVDLLESYRKGVEAFEEQRTIKVSGQKSKILTASEALKKKVASYKLKDKASVVDKIAELETVLNSVQSEHETLAALTTKKSSLENIVSVQRASIEAKIGEAKKIKDQISNVHSLVGADCEECGKEHTQADMASSVHALTEKYKRTSATVADLKAPYMILKSDSLEASDKARDYAVSMTDVSVTTTQLAALRIDLRALETELQSIITDKADIVAIKARLESIEAEVNSEQVLFDDGNARIARTRVSIFNVEEEIDKKDLELKIRRGVVKVFGPAGVRAHILDTVTPQLNNRTADYLSTLSDGNLSAQWNTLKSTSTGDVRELFNITVASKTGGGSFKELSGGEKRKVRLATNLALQDLVSSRATKPIDLFIGDEIDHALDVSGLERLMALLEERAKVRGSVIVISHNELGEFIRQVVKVTKKDGYATIEDCV